MSGLKPPTNRLATPLTGARALLAMITIAAAPPMAGAAGEPTLKSMRKQGALIGALQHEAAYTNKVCGGALGVSIDWRSLDAWPASADLAASCGRALSALEAMCRTPGRAAKARAIDQFVCAGDGAGPSLDGSTFRYGAAPRTDGFAETTRFLDGAL